MRSRCVARYRGVPVRGGTLGVLLAMLARIG